MQIFVNFVIIAPSLLRLLGVGVRPSFAIGRLPGLEFRPLPTLLWSVLCLVHSFGLSRRRDKHVMAQLLFLPGSRRSFSRVLSRSVTDTAQFTSLDLRLCKRSVRTVTSSLFSFVTLQLNVRCSYVIRSRTAVCSSQPTSDPSFSTTQSRLGRGSFDVAVTVQSGQRYRRYQTFTDGAARQPCSTCCGLRIRTSGRRPSSRPDNDRRPFEVTNPAS